MSSKKGVSKHLFPELADLPKTKNVPRRTRFRRCKSAPNTEDFVPIEKLVSTSSSSNDSSNNPFSTKSLLSNIRPSFRKVIIFLLFYFGLGTTCFYLFRDQLKGKKTNGVLDAIYFCIVTMTTVGYGDIVPNSKASKLLACVFVFTGMALVCLTLSKAANYLVEKQELLVVKALNKSKNTNQLQAIEEAKNNRTKYKCIMISVVLLVLMTIGVIFLTSVENLDFVDAFYCVCCTVTTLGYGDVSFSTQGGRVFAIFWIMISTICLAQFFLYIAELNTELRQRELVDMVLNRPMTNIDLEAADLDDDGSVGAAEFIIYKLKEMGKVSSEDLSLIMVEFNSLDIDQSGTLSHSDITLAQLSPPSSCTPKK
ncbi:two-pore potassium channel 1-like isoform X1 [Humulus lupulus]|uniref:two-pore potassium channel 1-like isoform X1 n=1 Tax=Humulus lupulus TaxID=3486 RepID=UPI002B40E1DF|nr:two-pore potassium channel 1-like isoform X1 [Humulus lupulus]XP_062078831.1 two-pore potassium channel 1-like isoform X1 [Humulus lupulus]